MPRLTLYKPTKTNDYYFMDRQIREQFDIGGVGVIVHKYLGPQDIADQDDKTQPKYTDSSATDANGNLTNVEPDISELDVQDVLFLENRDRVYDPDIYELRGVYNVADNDFDLSQFGLFLTNDTLFMTFHMNDMVTKLGRRLMSGDVIELPHLLDELALDQSKAPIPKFYSVTDAARGSEGFSQTWYPHIWRVKLAPLNDAQEYTNLLGSNEDENSIASLVSTYNQEIDINKKIQAQADADNGMAGLNSDHLYVLPENENPSTDWAYGETLASGLSFPADPNQGDYFLRTDFDPNRLFVRRGAKWVRLYDNVQKTDWESSVFGSVEGFVNQLGKDQVSNDEFDIRQPLSGAGVNIKKNTE